MNQVLASFSRFWSNLRRQSEPLQGIAALLAILTIGPTLIFPIYRRVTRPAIVVKIDVAGDARPPDIREWMSNVSGRRFFSTPEYLDDSAEVINALTEKLDDLPNLSNEERVALKRQLVFLEKSLSGFREEYELLTGLDNGISVEKLIEASLLFQRGQLGKLHIEILNQSNQTASDLSLRVSRLGYLWSSTITGTFITPEQSKKLNETLKANYQDKENYLVLPKVPEIPPNSSLEITLYGDIEIALQLAPEVQVESENNSLVLKQRVKLDEGLIVRWLLEPWRFYGLLGTIMLVMFWPIFFIISSQLSDSAYRYRRGKRFYFAAQYLAKMKRYEEAISVFEVAKTFGNFHFSNESQIREDQKLFPEDQQEEFLQVFSLKQSKKEE
ncbi:hypothetical protein N836_28810 [Leptolyngbya sp. Heron Island J]|uniref:hypothetical protein n=1 Tax=Leptolyngbya sp. Heron Island J TaxID=1385935 RepID=UPI0003B94F5D|nr:hypothetical protein [Leptolyngbya sp. Heron Island J]ESA39130.1 hypothetical protein N836_28810 [Leptolyngbya sp. Heron Island J]